MTDFSEASSFFFVGYSIIFCTEDLFEETVRLFLLSV